MKSVSEVLTAATTLLEQGWCQGSAKRVVEGYGVSYCMAGALQEIAPTFRDNLGTPETFAAYHATRALIIAALPEGFDQLVSYNDTVGRTKAEVLAVMAKAYETARQNDLVSV